MVKPTVEIEGTEVLKRNFEKLAEEYSEEIVKGAVIGAELVRGDAIKSIQSASSGSQVTRHTTTGQPYSHVAAKAGAAPNTDTGRLVASIQVETKGGGLFGESQKGIFVGSTLLYAAYLEQGTRIMAARPWLMPALERNRENIFKLIGKRVDDVTIAGNRLINK